jgi:hypothetical protein
MSDVIKNPNRANQPQQKPYEPEYARKGIKVVDAPVGSLITATATSLSKKRDANPPLQQEIFNSINGVDLDIDGNEVSFESGHVIDNNEFVNWTRYEVDPRAQQPKIKIADATQTVLQQTVVEETTPQVGDYILMVFGKLVSSGSVEKIEKLVRDIMYGDNKDFSDEEITVDDIVVLKRVEVKIGIFVSK